MGNPPLTLVGWMIAAMAVVGGGLVWGWPLWSIGLIGIGLISVV